MLKTSLGILTLTMFLQTPTLAAFHGDQSTWTVAASTTGMKTYQLRKLGKVLPPPSANAARKSKRQKCLDMMLPQDGAACLKKLKAKGK